MTVFLLRPMDRTVFLFFFSPFLSFPICDNNEKNNEVHLVRRQERRLDISSPPPLPMASKGVEGKMGRGDDQEVNEYGTFPISSPPSPLPPIIYGVKIRGDIILNDASSGLIFSLPPPSQESIEKKKRGGEY